MYKACMPLRATIQLGEFGILGAYHHKVQNPIINGCSNLSSGSWWSDVVIVLSTITMVRVSWPEHWLSKKYVIAK